MVAIGVDIGNVIIGGDTDNNAMFSDQYLMAPELPGAIETIAWLNQRSPFRGRVFLVSKCGENVQRKTWEWLAGRKFYEVTGVAEANVRFCEHRNEKAPIAKQLALTHFVDDRLEILKYLDGICASRFLFRGKAKEIKEHLDALRTVTPVESWKELRSLLGSVR